ncbi:hypothetical protein AAFF_G00263130 [Aldrovandia affinis]|uniref:Uncharacterized protein n=1 Tax=Aldrovandia affinis TaxID=143900 RepID=A0AAD7ST22_9TELE|nr:hypothetical protein AAFF_G00263130 [Aldrovandia affinis]
MDYLESHRPKTRGKEKKLVAQAIRVGDEHQHIGLCQCEISSHHVTLVVSQDPLLQSAPGSSAVGDPEVSYVLVPGNQLTAWVRGCLPSHVCTGTCLNESDEEGKTNHVHVSAEQAWVICGIMPRTCITFASPESPGLDTQPG